MGSQFNAETRVPRRQFAEWALVAAILTGGAMISVYYAWSEQRLTEATEAARMAAQARVVEQQVQHRLLSLHAALDSVRAALPDALAACSARCTRHTLQSVRDALPGVRALLVVDRAGNLLASDGSSEAQQFDGHKLAERLAGMHDAGSLYLIQPGQDPLSRDAGVFLPLPDGGAVLALLRQDFFGKAMRSILYAPDMQCIIADGSGLALATMPRGESDGADTSRVEIGREPGLDGERLVVQRTMAIADAATNRPLVVGISRDLKALLQPSQHLVYVYGMAWLVLALASITVLITVQRRRDAMRRSSERHQAERAADADRIDLALEGGGLGLWEWDLASDRIRLDARGAAMLGMTLEEAGQTAREHRWIDDVHPDDRQLVQQSLARHLNGGDAAFEAEYRQRHASGAWVWILSRGKIVQRDADGRALRLLGTRQDIGARKQAEAEIQHLAFYDSLTELPNRRLLHDRLAQAIAKSTRKRRAGAVLFVDLDNFKNLNDTLGHDIGDRLLQQVASRLRTVTREADTVARLGGDEFVILLEDLDDFGGKAEAHASLVAEKILEALCAPYGFERHEVHITPSIGIAVFGDPERPAEELLKQADLAMYDAKAAGRNTFRFFAPIMQLTLDEMARIENDLRHAIRRGQLLLHFQPIVDAAGDVTCAEALLRWNHPERGLLNPGQFIPVAEKSGLILSIGQWVLDEACRQMALWSREAHGRPVKVAVNVSARQFRQDDFVDQVLRALQGSGADPRQLKLELTESIVLDDVEEVIAKMATLKAHGVSFALDDFGTGYSSLSYLQRLPLDQLKIDKSFVQDMLSSQNAATIVGAIVNLASSLGMDVVAEGVETERQRQFLAGCGCRYYQGYLIARPVPAESMSFHWRLPAQSASEQM